MFTTLISARELQHLMASGAPLRVFDCSFELMKPDAGAVQYREEHIPGSVYVHLDQHLSDKDGADRASGGRHPLPSRETFARRMASLGLSDGEQVVVLDRQGANYCGRLWWMLKWCGHEAVALLDGGLAAWKAANLPLSSETPRPLTEGNISVRPDPYKVIDAQTILRRLDENSMQLLDARAPERFRGAVEPIDPIAGHIPGAANLPCAANLDGKGLWLSPKALRLRFAPWVNSNKTLVCYCGSGVTACHSILAAVEAGLAEPVLYAGSWSEWITQPGRPVATGE